MKKAIVLTLLLGMALASCNTASKTPKSEMDSVAYAFSAMQFGPHIAYLDSTENLSVDMIVAAIYDAVGGKSKMTPEEAQEFMNEYFSVRLPAKNLKEAEAFLAENEKKPSVEKTESGLLYEIITPGSAVKATNDADTVVVLYTGTLPNGTVFDSTASRNNEPATFPLDRVIPAWTEGMKLVGEGGKIKLYAHPNLAYGSQGQGQSIAPNQALQFEVEILEVKPAVQEAE